MSGNASVRGYLLQTIICLLDALQSGNRWESVALEPHLDSGKVDIIWYYAKSNSKVTQVKSSQNSIEAADAKRWANELETSIPATSYELLLIGPCTQGVVDLKEVGKVKIPTPYPLNIDGLIDQAAHRLGKFCEEIGLPGVGADFRELLVRALITELESYSTTGSSLSREELEQLLQKWIYSIRSQEYSSQPWENPTRITSISQETVRPGNEPNISIQSKEV